ncbi:hypothetical protein [Paenibacillus sp. PSB04]|uniref:hypothetical protein n=1 Tax=Paenibacillus sp. PSB04 TaxID=2866810 RepID=UPI0021F2350A|nr:hypothetical protein [Paenibacillus sp. PSB04]UYO02910.1 hypothetical protein K2F33_24750 [Paenibacillus sp. PSB04]
MNRKHSIFAAACTGIALLLFFIVMMYNNPQTRGRVSLEKQLNTIIANHAVDQIKSLSQNEQTYQFMARLSPTIQCKRTSDIQGMDRDSQYYYVTTLDDRKVDVYVRKGDWKVTGIHLQ